jgi:transcriptional regulator with XRE-family HTH domain
MVQQMQLRGVDINPSSLSKLEGQVRIASDRELYAIAQIFSVPMEELIHPKEEKSE